MRLDCPHCGFGPCARNGSETVTSAYLAAGRVAYRAANVTRTKCRACGRSGRVAEANDAMAEADLREHVVAQVFALGRNGAAAETGIPATTVNRHVRAWGDVRERDVLDAAPDGLMIEPVRLLRSHGLLVVDVDRRSLVEMLRDVDGLAAWLDAPTRAPALEACIPLDPRVAAIVRERTPSTRILVSPDAVDGSVRATALLALRSLRQRRDMAGRNGMPTLPEFGDALRSGVEHEGWPPEASCLLRGAGLALEVCAVGSEAEAVRLWPEMAVACSGREARSIWAVMRTWRDPLLAGLGRADIRQVAAMAGEVGRSLAARKPALGYGDLRAYALLQGFERRAGGILFPGHNPGSVAVGADLDALLARLAA